MSEISTKPYLLRAIYEWCTDNGFTPYLSVKVTAGVQVPMEFVRKGEIVLNVSFTATSSLKMDNDAITFKARFGGVSREIYVPVANVQAIFASENGQGMVFDAIEEELLSAVEPEVAKPGLGLAAVSSPAGLPEKNGDAEKISQETQKKIRKTFPKNHKVVYNFVLQDSLQNKRNAAKNETISAGLAHLVEQLTCNHQVASSIPAAGTN